MPRDATNTPASHTSALGELFIADEWEIAQEGILDCEIFISLVRGGNDGSTCEFDSGKQIPRDEAARNDKILLMERLYFAVWRLWKLDGYVFRGRLGGVGDGVGGAAGNPFGFACLEVEGFGGFAFFVAAKVFASQIKVADGD